MRSTFHNEIARRDSGHSGASRRMWTRCTAARSRVTCDRVVDTEGVADTGRTRLFIRYHILLPFRSQVFNLYESMRIRFPNFCYFTADLHVSWISPQKLSFPKSQLLTHFQRNISIIIRFSNLVDSVNGQARPGGGVGRCDNPLHPNLPVGVGCVKRKNALPIVDPALV